MVSNGAIHIFLTHREKGISKMATSKTFKVIGVSTLKGKTKVRFANDMTRIKILVKNGHTNVELFELPEAMTKEASIAYARANNLFAVPADAEASADDVVAAAQGE
jgi:hypothetical protein